MVVGFLRYTYRWKYSEQKTKTKTNKKQKKILILDPLPIVKFKALINFNKWVITWKLRKNSNTSNEKWKKKMSSSLKPPYSCAALQL